MTKDQIVQIALDHAVRGIYDNSCARSGIQRNVYAYYWATASAAMITPKE